MKIIDREGLREKGVRFSRQHINRLERSRKFPAHVNLGENTVGWVEDEIDAWLTAKIAERDAATTT